MAQTADCMRKCEKVGEIAPTEIGYDTVLAKRAMEVESSKASIKRRKLESNADRDRLSLSQQCNKKKSPEESATSAGSNCVPVTRCSSEDSSELLKHKSRSLDLKVEVRHGIFESDIKTIADCTSFSGETTTSSELCADTDCLESSALVKPSEASLRRIHPAAKMPAAAEIEEFFSAAEKSVLKRFSDKYNYDVVKDVPLEGRYQWIRLKP
ncbi:hypothetical protein NMG60_11015306 [Bertholletia excelsa]